MGVINVLYYKIVLLKKNQAYLLLNFIHIYILGINFKCDHTINTVRRCVHTISTTIVIISTDEVYTDINRMTTDMLFNYNTPKVLFKYIGTTEVAIVTQKLNIYNF